MPSNVFKSSISETIEDPVQQTFEDLALQLYKPKSNGSALMKGTLGITPPVSDQEAFDFSTYWLNRETNTPTFPQLWQFKKWLSDKREESRDGCPFKICDGTGYIELFNPIDTDKYARDGYLWDKKCACIIGDKEHKKLLFSYRYTPYQEVIISNNGGTHKNINSEDMRGIYNE